MPPRSHTETTVDDPGKVALNTAFFIRHLCRKFRLKPHSIRQMETPHAPGLYAVLEPVDKHFPPQLTGGTDDGPGMQYAPMISDMRHKYKDAGLIISNGQFDATREHADAPPHFIVPLEPCFNAPEKLATLVKTLDRREVMGNVAHAASAGLAGYFTYKGFQKLAQVKRETDPNAPKPGIDLPDWVPLPRVSHPSRPSFRDDPVLRPLGLTLSSMGVLLWEAACLDDKQSASQAIASTVSEGNTDEELAWRGFATTCRTQLDQRRAPAHSP